MAQSKPITLDDLEVMFYLIFEDIYRNGLNPYSKSIFYPQVVQIWKRMGMTREEGSKSRSARLLEEYFLDEAIGFAENLFNHYEATRAVEFRPECILRPPTLNRDLQQSVFDRFCDGLVLRDNDLTSYFQKNENDEIILTEDISARLKDRQNILIIDDAYATGATVRQIIFLLGREKSYMVVCPLLVEK